MVCPEGTGALGCFLGKVRRGEEGGKRVEDLLPISGKRSQNLQRLMTGDLFSSIAAKLGIS